MGSMTLLLVAVAGLCLATMASCSRTGISTQSAGGDGGRPTSCGNAIVEAGEACDDGNTVATDACRSDCTLARCGDAIVAAVSEVCDDGNGVDSDGCRNDCTLPTCGNGVIDLGEECDDAGTSAGCTPACRFPLCGDGFVDLQAEECDEGPANATIPALALVQDAVARPVRPVTVSATLGAFYGYASASAHTGFEVAGGSRLYFHQDASNGTLGIITHHGIDKGLGAFPQPKAKVEQRFSFLPPEVSIAVADDKPEEFFRSSPTVIMGSWGFDDNTDGGAIGTVPFPGAWAIHVEPTFKLGIQEWGFVDAGAAVVELSMSAPVDLVAYDGPAACRLDCTLARCGDAVLDAGEICDDGNVVSGDGCSDDCATMP